MKIDTLIEKRKKLWEERKDLFEDMKYLQAICNKILTDTEFSKSFIEEIKKDKEKLIELFFYINDKNQETKPFFFNEVQLEFINILRKAKQDYLNNLRNSLKFIILKGRQQGFTSLITAIQLTEAITEKNFFGYTISHDRDSTVTIFETKAKFPYNMLPDTLKPIEENNNRQEIAFRNLNSKWKISTAGSGGVGRGKTLSFFHGSEVAFYQDLKKLLISIAPSFTKNCVVLLETTANGYNYFKEVWDLAKKNENDFEAVFFEWWKTKEYVLNFENEDIEKEFNKNLLEPNSDIFKKLNLLYKTKNLTIKQLYWYYAQYKTLREKVAQEYPCNDAEAFLHTGRPYFELEVIDKIIINYDYKVIETLEGGLIQVYEKPIEGVRYCLGADVAEGLKGRDYSSAAMYRTDTWEQVIKIHGHISPPLFGECLVKYAKKYNDCFLIIENNNHGWSVLNTIYHQLKYKNIYFTTTQQNKKDEITKKMGWSTTSTSKYIALDEFSQSISEGSIIIKDLEAIKQIREVIYDESGNVVLNGKDLVVANMLANQGKKYMRKEIILW